MFKKTALWFVLVIVNALWFVNLAQAAQPKAKIDPAKSRCPHFDDESIGRLVSMLDDFDRTLPNIPPEEAAYLNAETNRALNIAKHDFPSYGQSGRIFATLSLRPLYGAWKLRKQLEETRNGLLAITAYEGVQRSYVHNDEAEKLDRAARAISKVSDFRSEALEYLNSNPAKIFAMRDPSEFSHLISIASMLPSDLGFYIQCKLAKIVGPQSFP